MGLCVGRVNLDSLPGEPVGLPHRFLKVSLPRKCDPPNRPTFNDVGICELRVLDDRRVSKFRRVGEAFLACSVEGRVGERKQVVGFKVRWRFASPPPQSVGQGGCGGRQASQ